MLANASGRSCARPKPGMTACPPKLALAERPLLSKEKANELTGVFKILANDTRLRLLHALGRDGEVCVSDLAAAVGMNAQAVSNQLQRLSAQRIVAFRREGNQVFYRIVDPCVTALLDHGLCLAEDSKHRSQ